jgi:multiple sugar transport system permease protein
MATITPVKAFPKTLNRTQSGREWLWAYALLAPSIILFTLFILIPIISTIALSLTDWNMLTSPEFVGLANYQTLLEDTRLALIVRNTLVFALFSVLAKIVLGLVLAYLVWSIKPKLVTSVLESALFFPVILPMAVVAMVWGLLLNTDSGVVNGLLSMVGLAKIPWLTDVNWALPTLIMLDVWRGLGFFFIVDLVALRNVPKDFYEAAAIDGAGKWALFRYITLPSISPTTLFLFVIGAIGSLQAFDLSYILTRGGPGDATTTLGYYLWQNAFQFLHMGYGATVALLLFVFILAFTILQFALSKRWVFYG